MAKIELKPCPFCGSRAKIFYVDSTNDYCVVCQDEDLLCCARLPYCRSEEEAKMQWNKRL